TEQGTAVSDNDIEKGTRCAIHDHRLFFAHADPVAPAGAVRAERECIDTVINAFRPAIDESLRLFGALISDVRPVPPTTADQRHALGHRFPRPMAAIVHYGKHAFRVLERI